MALFPCDQHGGRYRGPQQTAYPAIVNGSMNMRERRRLCPDCFATLKEWCASWLRGIADAEVEDECFDCHAPSPTHRIFVTLYGKGDDRVDFYGQACATHATEIAALWLFGTQRGLPEP